MPSQNTVFIGSYEKNRKKIIWKIGLYRTEPEPDRTVPLRAESRRAGPSHPNADPWSKLTNFHGQKSGNQSGFGDRSGGLQLRIIFLRIKFCILFSEILHLPDLWIFRALKIRPQIG